MDAVVDLHRAAAGGFWDHVNLSLISKYARIGKMIGSFENGSHIDQFLFLQLGAGDPSPLHYIVEVLEKYPQFAAAGNKERIRVVMALGGLNP